jgi:hypothetical protein
MRLRQQAPPAVKRCFAARVDKASGQRRFDIACGLHKQGRERAVLLDKAVNFKLDVASTIKFRRLFAPVGDRV